MAIFPEQPVLIVDDEPAFLQSLSLTLKRFTGVTNLVQCDDSCKVPELLEHQKFSLAIIDLMMPHLSGDQLLEHINSKYPDLPAIILTGMNQVELAVKCIKEGAFDYFVKTGESERLVAGVTRALKHSELRQECDRLRKSVITGGLEQPEAFADILTASQQMQAVFTYVEAVSKSREPVLISGESGVGKELVARAFHRLSQPEGPLVTVNVAGLDDNVFSDTLFGHLKGAFTGADQDRPGMIERANGGILFLDEIGDLALESQVKLLRLLQEGEYQPLGSDRPKRSSARIVVATNQDLNLLQQQGHFRKDLYYRLCGHLVEIPPLRERKDDLPILLEHFLAEAATSLNKKKPTPPEELVTLLTLYPFPGNVRELRSMVFDAVSQHKAKKLSMASFEKAIGIDTRAVVGDPQKQNSSDILTFHEKLPTLKQAADLLVCEAMQRTGGNQSMSAKLLGITQPSLYSRWKKLKPKRD